MSTEVPMTKCHQERGEGHSVLLEENQASESDREKVMSPFSFHPEVKA